MHKNWKEIKESNDLEQIKENSKKSIIFKHSTRCGISMSAYEELYENWDDLGQKYELYYLDLLNYRAISAEIAESFEVIHQSPQIIIVSENKVEKVLTHFAIKAAKL